jgi:hypothetical protein
VTERFVDRALESRTLTEAWDSGRPELVLVHGRRRVGKSELLARFVAHRPVAYYVAAQQLPAVQLADIGRVLGAIAGGIADIGSGLAIGGWEEALDVVARASERRRVGLVLDEFPYLADADPALPSLVQRWWDAVGSRRNVVIVLAGSEQAMMRRLASVEGALYGRPTRAIRVRPLDYYHSARFVSAWSPEDRVRAYAVAGGMPDYLEELQAHAPLRDEVLRLAFTPAGRFFREAPDLLRSELIEPRTYESILRAMARGEHQPSAIAARAGMRSAATVAPYMDRLIGLELVERRTPPMQGARPRPRTSRYVIADPYLRFYFGLVDPWRSAIALGQGARVLDALWPVAFDEHVSRVFEEVASQYVRRLSGAGDLPLLQTVGQHWLDAGDIDVVGVAGGRMTVAASAKWTREHMKLADLADLRRDVSAVDPGGSPDLLLLSRSGFHAALRRERGVRLVGLRDLFRADLDFERAAVTPPR